MKTAIAVQEKAYGITGGELVCLEFGAAPDYNVLGSKTSERIDVFWLKPPFSIGYERGMALLRLVTVSVRKFL